MRQLRPRNIKGLAQAPRDCKWQSQSLKSGWRPHTPVLPQCYPASPHGVLDDSPTPRPLPRQCTRPLPAPSPRLCPSRPVELTLGFSPDTLPCLLSEANTGAEQTLWLPLCLPPPASAEASEHLQHRSSPRGYFLPPASAWPWNIPHIVKKTKLLTILESADLGVNPGQVPCSCCILVRPWTPTDFSFPIYKMIGHSLQSCCNPCERSGTAPGMWKPVGIH